MLASVVVGFFIPVPTVLYTLGDSLKLLADRNRHEEALKALEFMAKAKGTDDPSSSLTSEYTEKAGLQGLLSSLA